MTEKFLARHTTASLETLVNGKRGVIALVPVGSTEPHGPHLGLGTDVVISAAACLRAAELLEKRGTMVGLIAPAISYGVTECATGFAGAVTIPAAVLTQYIAAVCDGLIHRLQNGAVSRSAVGVYKSCNSAHRYFLSAISHQWPHPGYAAGPLPGSIFYSRAAPGEPSSRR